MSGSLAGAALTPRAPTAPRSAPAVTACPGATAMRSNPASSDSTPAPCSMMTMSP